MYVYILCIIYICVSTHISVCVESIYNKKPWLFRLAPAPKKQIQLRSQFHGRKIHQEYIIYTLWLCQNSY